MIMQCSSTGLADAHSTCAPRPDLRRSRRVEAPNEPRAGEVIAMATSTVLIVDDDCSFVEALATFLEDNGYRPLRAVKGSDGRRLIRQSEVDLAIIDVHMPDLDGVDLLMEARRLATPVPVIMISSDDGSETVDRCRGSGAALFMAKPIAPDALLEAIRRAIERRAS